MSEKVKRHVRKLCWKLFSRYPATDLNGKRVWILNTAVGSYMAKTGYPLISVRPATSKDLTRIFNGAAELGSPEDFSEKK